MAGRVVQRFRECAKRRVVAEFCRQCGNAIFQHGHSRAARAPAAPGGAGIQVVDGVVKFYCASASAEIAPGAADALAAAINGVKAGMPALRSMAWVVFIAASAAAKRQTDPRAARRPAAGACRDAGGG